MRGMTWWWKCGTGQVGGAGLRNEKEKKNPTFLGPWERQRLAVTLLSGPEAEGTAPPGMAMKRK